MSLLARLKWHADRAFGRIPGIRPDICVPVERHGSAYGGWCINPDKVNAGTVIYSFGLGEDVTFEESMIARYGLRVEGFDPTPRSCEWVGRRNMPTRFRLHPVGLGGRDEVRTLWLPADPTHISLSVLGRGERGQSMELPLKRLTTLMAEIGDASVDILKMDIEGAEYEAIDDLAGGPVRPRQLLVEFHHRFRGAGVRRTRAAVRTLKSLGYRLFWVSDSGEEYAFAHAPRAALVFSATADSAHN